MQTWFIIFGVGLVTWVLVELCQMFRPTVKLPVMLNAMASAGSMFITAGILIK